MEHTAQDYIDTAEQSLDKAGPLVLGPAGHESEAMGFLAAGMLAALVALAKLQQTANALFARGVMLQTEYGDEMRAWRAGFDAPARGGLAEAAPTPRPTADKCHGHIWMTALGFDGPVCAVCGAPAPEPEAPAATEPEAPAATEPEGPAATEPEAPAATEPEPPATEAP